VNGNEGVTLLNAFL